MWLKQTARPEMNCHLWTETRGRGSESQLEQVQSPSPRLTPESCNIFKTRVTQDTSLVLMVYFGLYCVLRRYFWEVIVLTIFFPCKAMKTVPFMIDATFSAQRNCQFARIISWFFNISSQKCDKMQCSRQWAEERDPICLQQFVHVLFIISSADCSYRKQYTGTAVSSPPSVTEVTACSSL